LNTAARTFSLTLRTLAQLDALVASDSRRARLDLLAPSTPQDTSSPPTPPPPLDASNLAPQDYSRLAMLAGAPRAKADAVTTSAQFSDLVTRYLKSDGISAFNLAMKTTAAANRKAARSARRAIETFERVQAKLRQRRLQSQSAVVDALLRLGLDTLEEKVTRGTEKEYRGSRGNAGQAKDKSANRASRQAVAA